jgi:MOSC domain-containing protein YiiM
MALSGRVVSVNAGVAGADFVTGDASTAPIYAYPSEHYPFWQTVRAQAGRGRWDEPLAPGSLGEQLTTAGVLETQLFVGDVLRFSGCVLAVSAPHVPGGELDAALGFRHAAKLMTESAWCGWHLAIRERGTIAAGDAFEVVPGPREVSVWELFRARTRRVG